MAAIPKYALLVSAASVLIISPVNAQKLPAKAAADSAHTISYADIRFGKSDKGTAKPVGFPPVVIIKTPDYSPNLPAGSPLHVMPLPLTTAQPALVGRVGNQYYINSNSGQALYTKKQ